MTESCSSAIRRLRLQKRVNVFTAEINRFSVWYKKNVFGLYSILRRQTKRKRKRRNRRRKKMRKRKEKQEEGMNRRGRERRKGKG